MSGRPCVRTSVATSGTSVLPLNCPQELREPGASARVCAWAQSGWDWQGRIDSVRTCAQVRFGVLPYRWTGSQARPCSRPITRPAPGIALTVPSNWSSHDPQIAMREALTLHGFRNWRHRNRPLRLGANGPAAETGEFDEMILQLLRPYGWEPLSPGARDSGSPGRREAVHTSSIGSCFRRKTDRSGRLWSGTGWKVRRLHNAVPQPCRARPGCCARQARETRRTLSGSDMLSRRKAAGGNRTGSITPVLRASGPVKVSIGAWSSDCRASR